MEWGYVNYFDEIKDRSREEQLEILEKARYEAFVVQRLAARSIGYFLLELLVSFVLCTAVIIYFDFGSIPYGLNFLPLFFLLFPLGMFLHRRLHGKLLHKGLTIVLSAEAIQRA
jgi:hypothetical protein